MRPRVAKSGTIHIQESMFTTDERDEMEAPAPKTIPASQAYTITFGQVYNAVLDAYRAGEPPEAIEVTTAGGYAVHPKFAQIIDANNGQRYDWQEVHDAAHTIYLAESRPDEPMPSRLAPPKEPPNPATYLVTYPQALELMLDALRKEANPWEAEVVFPGDKRVPLYVCQVDGEMKLTHALHHAQHQRDYELKVEAHREEAELARLPKPDWSM